MDEVENSEEVGSSLISYWWALIVSGVEKRDKYYAAASFIGTICIFVCDWCGIQQVTHLLDDKRWLKVAELGGVFLTFYFISSLPFKEYQRLRAEIKALKNRFKSAFSVVGIEKVLSVRSATKLEIEIANISGEKSAEAVTVEIVRFPLFEQWHYHADLEYPLRLTSSDGVRKDIHPGGKALFVFMLARAHEASVSHNYKGVAMWPQNREPYFKICALDVDYDVRIRVTALHFNSIERDFTFRFSDHLAGKFSMKLK